jgi:hypothetical protein
LVDRYPYFKGVHCLHLQDKESSHFFYLEDGNSRLLQNVGTGLPNYMTSHPIRYDLDTHW